MYFVRTRINLVIFTIAMFTCLSVMPVWQAGGSTQTQILTPFDVIPYTGSDSNPQFGWTMTMAGDRIIVGSPSDGAGRVYIYDINNLSANPTILSSANVGQSRGRFGSGLAVQGNILAIGSPSSGTGYVDLYDLSTGQFFQHFQPTGMGSSSPYFGVTLDLDGDRLVVGASRESAGVPMAGAAYLFDLNTGQQIARIIEPTPSEDSNFGLSLDLDGNQFLVGSNNGNAHLFDSTTGQIIRTFSGNEADLFGIDVALSDSNALVGAIWYEAAGAPQSSGGVFVYDRQSGQSKGVLATNPVVAQADFGRDLDTHNDQLLALAAGNGSPPEQAYLFDTQTGQITAILNLGITFFDGEVYLNDSYALVSRDTGSASDQAIYIFQVPEPTSASLMGLALLACTCPRRRANTSNRIDTE